MIPMSIDKETLTHNPSGATAEQLLATVKQYMGDNEVEQVAQAIQLAQETSGSVRDHGVASLQTLRQISPLEHALAVATILAQMRIDAVGVAAGMVFEAVDAELLPLKHVERTLGIPVGRVVGSMLRLNILERKKNAGAQLIAPNAGEGESNRDQKKRRVREALRRQQAETVRKMFIGMAEDPRVVLLKLAYRLHAMRLSTQKGHLSLSTASDQQEKLAMALETREIYAPLAGRLGMSRVESELEDLTFEVLEPDKYAWIKSQVETESKKGRSYVERVCTRLSDAMADYGASLDLVYRGAGHRASASAKELLSCLRQLADWQRDLRSTSTSDAEFVEAVKDDFFEEQIFVFTPKGEVKDLPVGSTPLDFAYRIHSKVGDRCAGARIITESTSGVTEGDRLVTRMVPLDYELKSGEIVDIVTSRTAHPTRDWLNFARTSAARSKIRRYLKTHERDINMQIGRERLDRELKVLGVARGVEALTEDAEKWLEEEYNGKSFEDLLAAIGGDDIRQHAVAMKLIERWHQLRELREGKETTEENEPLPLPTATPKQASPAHLQVAGVSGLLTNLANCCCPLPGDEIVGYISRGKGAIVHRADCRNIDRYRERDRERLISVSWVSMGKQRYRAPILITVRDRAGLIRDIATVVSETGVNMTSVSSNVSGGKELALISVTLEIESMEQLQRVFTKVEKVKGVRHVERDLGKSKKK